MGSGLIRGRPCGVFMHRCFLGAFQRAGDRPIRACRAACEREPTASSKLTRARTPVFLGGCSPRRHAETARPVGRDLLHRVFVRPALGELPPLPPPRPVRSPLRALAVGSGRSRRRAPLRRTPPRTGDIGPALDPGDRLGVNPRPRPSRQSRALPAAQRACRVHDHVAAEHLGRRGPGCRGSRRPQ